VAHTSPEPNKALVLEALTRSSTGVTTLRLNATGATDIFSIALISSLDGANDSIALMLTRSSMLLRPSIMGQEPAPDFCGRTTKSGDGRPSWITYISKAATSSLNSGTQDAPAQEVFSEISSRFPPPG
jgi:hypothetical protein